MSAVYQVAWSYCTVKILDPATGSMTVVGFGKDAIVPPSADPDDVKRLAGKGALVPVQTTPAREPVPLAAQVATPPAEADKPAKAPAKAADKAAAKSGNGS